MWDKDFIMMTGQHNVWEVSQKIATVKLSLCNALFPLHPPQPPCCFSFSGSKRNTAYRPIMTGKSDLFKDLMFFIFSVLASIHLGK